MKKYDISDMMAVTIARILKDGKNVFHGVASPLPMVSILLAKRLYAPDLVYLNITGSVNPIPYKLPKSTASSELLKGAKAYFSLSDIFDLSARGGLDFAFLSGVQIDSQGNVNNSVIGEFHKPKVRLPGGAGSAVLLPTAQRPILWRTKHDTKTFVDKCDFTTSTGNIYRVVTPLAVFKKQQGRLWLESIHPHSTLEEVRNNTGFELLYEKEQYTPEPTAEELRVLSSIDPEKIRSIEF